MKKYVIIHPEGNCNFNPHLYGLIEILLERSIEVEVVSQKRHFVQQTPPGSVLRLYTNNLMRKVIRRCLKSIIHPSFLRRFLVKLFLSGLKIPEKVDLLIGVDCEGIMLASHWAEMQCIPCGHISYELYFEKEAGIRLKKIERAACEKVVFSICQDKLRANYLRLENGIEQHKIINMPVAGRTLHRQPSSYHLHDKLGLDRNKRIALFIGSCVKWTMYDQIIESVKKWPENWVLVVNSRNTLPDFHSSHAERIYMLEEPATTFHDLSSILLSAEVGLAFYQPQYGVSIGLGLNLECIGLSSGKINTYLQHGLPIIINEIGEMSDLVRSHNLGLVIDSPEQLPTALVQMENLQLRDQCYSFFEKRLSLNVTVETFFNSLSINKV